MSETPKGVTIFTILQIIIAVFMLLLSGSAFVEVALEGLVTALGFVFAVFTLTLFGLMIIGPIGLVKYKSLWAYWLTFIVDIIYVLFVVIAFLAEFGTFAVFLFIIPLIFVIYLFIIRDRFK